MVNSIESLNYPFSSGDVIKADVSRARLRDTQKGISSLVKIAGPEMAIFVGEISALPSVLGIEVGFRHYDDGMNFVVLTIAVNNININVEKEEIAVVDLATKLGLSYKKRRIYTNSYFSFAETFEDAFSGDPFEKINPYEGAKKYDNRKAVMRVKFVD